jgi:hypothetical protein
MFKCEVVEIYKFPVFQETLVQFKVSKIGSKKLKNHDLVGTLGFHSFIIGQIDNSIKKGDLIRCDGLPYMSKPPLFNKVYTRDSNGTRVKDIRFNRPEGYKPFRLESGYWVLRKVK